VRVASLPADPGSAAIPTRSAPRSFGPLQTVGGRLRFLDLARGIAIVLMVLQHVQIVFVADFGAGSTLGTVFLVLGTAPAAPVFMVSMGLLFGTSPRAGVLSGLRRGIALFLLGYVLNLVRFTVPALVGDDTPLAQALGSPWTPLLEVDVLQLAGLSLMVLGVVKRCVRGAWLVVALAAAVAAVAPLLWGLGDTPWLDPLWGVGEWTSFPLFPWLAYPLLGLALARFTFRASSAWAVMRAWALSGLACLAAGGALVLLAGDAGGILAIGDYFRSGLPVQLVLAGFVLLWLPVLWWLDRQLSWRLVPRYLTSLSRHLTIVYLVQWLLIGWLALALGVVDQPSWLATLLGVPVLVASHLLALAYDRFVGRPWRERRSLERVFAEARRGDV
jgi:uncharacterized membrane protein